MYFKDVSNNPQEEAFDPISDDLKHDTAFVCKITRKVCEYVKGRRSHKKDKNTGWHIRQLYNKTFF